MNSNQTTGYYSLCACGHRYDHHRDDSDLRGRGECWTCDCKHYTPTTGAMRDDLFARDNLRYKIYHDLLDIIVADYLKSSTPHHRRSIHDSIYSLLGWPVDRTSQDAPQNKEHDKPVTWKEFKEG